jgi:hypothetical protein
MSVFLVKIVPILDALQLLMLLAGMLTYLETKLFLMTIYIILVVINYELL